MKRRRRWTLIVLSVAIALFALAGCDNPVGTPSDDGGDTPSPTTPDPPAAPGGLASSSVSHDSVTLSWDTVADATGYELYRSDDATVTTDDTLVYDDSGTSTTDTTVEPSTTYYYAVLATNSDGSSSLSSPISVATPEAPETPPATPTNFTVTSATESSMVLEWDAVADADEYFLYASDTDPAALEAANRVDEADRTDTTAGVSGLDPDTPYYFALVASNAVGESGPATTSGSTTSVPDTPPANAPENFAVVDSTETTSGFELSWDAVAEASSYKVYRSTTTGVTTGDTVAYDGPVTTFEETGLASGTTYYYAVLAANFAGDSSLSAEIDATTLPAAPGAPSVTANATNPTTELDVVWDEVTVAAVHSLGYEVAYDTSSGFTGGGTESASASPHTISGLDTGTAYYVRVRAVFDNGLAGPWSSIRTGSTDAVLTAPANLAVGGATTNSLDVSWDAVTGADGYRLYRGPSAGSWTEIYVGTDTTHTDTGLDANTDYHYAVKAYDTNGSSDLSDAAAGQTLAAAPGAPTGLVATVLDASRIMLEWDEADGADAYVVQRDGSDVSGNLIATSYTDSGLAASTTYTYTVYAKNAQGSGPESDAVDATTMSGVPATPTGVTAGNATTITIDVSWSGDAQADSYKVYRSTDDVDYDYVTLETGTAYTDTGLQHSTTYYYKVLAKNAAGESARSASATATTLAGVDRPSIESLYYLVDSILVWWQPVENATEYELQRSDADVTSYETVYTGSDFGFVDGTITAGQDYRYRVRARNANGPGWWSSARSAYAPSSPPAAPALSIYGQTDTTVDLSWTDESAQYEVYRSTTPGVDENDTLVYPSEAPGVYPGFTDTGLDPETDYYYAVRALNYAGESSFSDEQQVTTNPAPGTPPSSLSMTATADSSIAIYLDWGATGADSYTVYRSTDDTVDTNDEGIYSGPATEFLDTGLDPGTQYWYGFVATNSAGSSDNFASPATATTEALTTPAAPILVIGSVESDPAAVYLMWNDLTEATEYRLYRSESDTGPWDGSTLLVTLPADTTSYWDEELAEADAYHYAVRGVNATVEGDISNVVRAAIVEVIVE